MRLTVLEIRAITIDIDTDNQEFAEKMAMEVYNDNHLDNNVMVVVSTEVIDGTNDSVDIYLDKDGDLILED